MSEQKLTVGRIVHYLTEHSLCRPAIVVAVDAKAGTANLSVFIDGDADFEESLEAGVHNVVLHRQRVNQGNKPREWHWPERD